MIRILIADDQELVRTGFRVVLDAEPDLEVVGEAADGVAALDAAETLRPDVVLMDIRMPNLDGIEATRRIAAGNGAPRILILTTFDLDDYVYEALRAGASGFLLKDARAEELRQAVRMVAAGDALLSPAITRRLIESYTRRPPPTLHPAPLAELLDGAPAGLGEPRDRSCLPFREPVPGSSNGRTPCFERGDAGSTPAPGFPANHPTRSGVCHSPGSGEEPEPDQSGL